MNPSNSFKIKLIHCGNINFTEPGDRGQKNIFFMPMGVFALADALTKSGYNTEIVHLDLEANKNKTLEEILDIERIDALGFDCHWANQSFVVLSTAKLLKKLNPNAFIFLGGYTASLFAEEILANHPQIDAVIRGDGEVPIVELCNILKTYKNKGMQTYRDHFSAVQNLTWRKENNEIILNDISYIGTQEKMESLDFAAFELLRNYDYYRTASLFYSHFTPINSTPMFLLEVGRGCQYYCTFCGGNCVAQKKISNRTQTIFRSVDSVIESILKAFSFGYRTFYSCMESEESNQWYIELFQKIRKENLLINYGYGCWRIPPNNLVDEISTACQQVVFEISPETSNEELRSKNKDPRICYTNKQLEDCLDFISMKNNIKVQLFFGYYVAGDTEEMIMNTIDYILRLIIKYYGIVEIEYANFSTDPGSLIFFNPGKYNMDINVRTFNDYIEHIRENYVEKEGQPADLTLFKPQYISNQENINVHRKILLLNYLFLFFRKSVSYILKKTNTPEFILDYITNAEISQRNTNQFHLNEVRDELLMRCRKENILDLDLSQLIFFEWEIQKSDMRVSKPTTQLYLDLEKVENIDDKINRNMFHVFLDSVKFGEKKESLHAKNPIVEDGNFEF